MRSLRSLFTIVAIAASMSAISELLVYKTYDDFVNKTPKAYADAEFKKWKGEENTVVVFGRGSKDDLDVDCANIWGFEYNKALFRVSKESKYFVKKGGVQLATPFAVTHLSDVVMYENGLGYLDAMRHERGQALLKGMCAALSKDLNSDMAVVPCYPGKWTDEQILKLVNEHPELKDLAGDLEALKKQDSPMSAGTFNYEQMRVFVKEYAENKKARGQ